MPWIALLVVGGYVVYVLRPDERRRVLVAADGALAMALHAVQSRRQRSNAFRDAVRARTRLPFVAAAVLVLQVSIFMLMVLAPGPVGDPDTVLRWGGSSGPLTTNGEWWRLLTATFAHSGIVQFAVDMAALSQAALLVEGLFGHVVFGSAYVAFALFAAAVGLPADPLAVTSGASGPIFGLHGLLAAFVVRGTVRRSPLTIPLSTLRDLAPPAAIFVLYCMWTGGPQWTAGLATCVIGFALGLALTKNIAERTPPLRRVLALTAIAFVVAAGVAATSRGVTDVRPALTRVVALEDRTSEIYRTATEQFKRGAIKADALAQLIDGSILPPLRAARTQLGALTGVPRSQRPFVETADEYLRVRSESWQMRAQALRTLNARMLRDADQRERASLDALDRLRPAVAAQALDAP